MITTAEFAGDPQKHMFVRAIHDSLNCVLCQKDLRSHTKNPADDGPEIDIICREVGDERFKIQIDWSRI